MGFLADETVVSRFDAIPLQESSWEIPFIFLTLVLELIHQQRISSFDVWGECFIVVDRYDNQETLKYQGALVVVHLKRVKFCYFSINLSDL